MTERDDPVGSLAKRHAPSVAVPPAYREAVLFAVTPRCGSTVMTEAVGSMGLARYVREVFNPRGASQKLFREVGGDNLQSYLNNVHQSASRTDIFLFKTSWSDLQRILRHKRLTDLFPSLRVVYIERNDKILQSISLYRAAVTNRFHKRIDGRWLESSLRDHVVDEDVQFDEEKIANFLGAIEKQCESWEAFFDSNEIEPYRLIYEDFEHSPQDVLSGIYGYICNEAYDGEVELGYQKLQDDLSSDWATRIRSRAGPAVA